MVRTSGTPAGHRNRSASKSGRFSSSLCTEGCHGRNNRWAAWTRHDSVRAGGAGALKPGMRVLLTAFGAGLTWAHHIGLAGHPLPGPAPEPAQAG